VIVAAVAVAVPASAGAGAASSRAEPVRAARPAAVASRHTAAVAVAPGPAGLRAFLLRADEAPADAFPRTPSFAWKSYREARSYDFELSTSRTFDDSAIVWSTATRARPLQVPAVAIPLSLPWMTGNPYALYAHVRARTAKGVTAWSAPFGFNMRWKSLPVKIEPDVPGLVRWQPVEGATSYEVWFVEAGKVISTTTNVADEREYYTFHATPDWTSTVTWRVRAVRKTYGALPNGLPVVTTGPWSETYTSTNPVPAATPITLSRAASDTVSTNAKPRAHSLTPGFVWSGDQGLDGTTASLYRVYVATDRQCVNVVFKGPVVGSPAWAPRTSGPLALPTTTAALAAAQSTFDADGAQTGTFSADFTTISTDEWSTAATPVAGGSPTPTTTTPTTTTTTPTTTVTTPTTTFTTPTTTTTTTTTTTPTATTQSAPLVASPTPSDSTSASSSLPSQFAATGSLVDLWDSGWPSGRYYWTVVPVSEVVSGSSVSYRDAEVPQDACNSGRVGQFGKTSQPATTSGARPFASGLSPAGALVSAKTKLPTFAKAALIAWQPALGATGYEVQWSKTAYPWKTASSTPFYTAATSVLLEGLAPGHWYYRVRGIDPYIPGPVKQMAWSAPVGIAIAKPTYSIAGAAASRSKEIPDVVVTPLRPK